MNTKTPIPMMSIPVFYAAQSHLLPQLQNRNPIPPFMPVFAVPAPNWQMYSTSSVPFGRNPTVMRPEVEALAIARIEYLFSFASIFGDQNLKSLMDKALWIPLEELMYDDKLICYGVTSTQCLDFLVSKSIATNAFTNLELDSIGMLARPKWAKTSQMAIKLAFASTYKGRLTKKAKYAKAKEILHRGLAACQSSQQVAHEPGEVKMYMTGRGRNGSYSAAFNAPAIPSLVESFLNGYVEDGIAVKVIECLDTSIFSNTRNEERLEK